MESNKPPLTRLDVLRGMRLSAAEGVWATVFGALTGGPFQIGFARLLGADDFALGLLAALPAATNLLQLPASLYGERCERRQRFIAFTAAPGRWSWALLLLIPFLLPPSLQVGAFLTLLTCGSALLAISTPVWTSMMSDMVPPGIRGQYFGRRNMLASIAAMLVPLPASAFLDQAIKYHRFAPRIGFAVIFAVALIAAIVSFVLILRQPDPPQSGASASSGRARGLKALTAPVTANANFRRFLIFSGATVFGQSMAGNFFTAWQIDAAGLRMPYLVVQLLGAVAAGAGLFTMPLWGMLGDKFGSRPVMSLCAGGVVLAPFIWLFTVPGESALLLNVALIVTLNLASGAFWAGLGLAQFNLLLALAPSGERGTYSAVFSALNGVVGAIAPLTGGALMGLLAGVAFPVGGGLVLNNYKILFLATGLMRLAFVFLLSGVHEPESQSARYVLGQLASSARRPVASYLTMRRLGQPVSEAERQRAVDTMADLRSPLMVEELSRALDDVSQEVRESAARALGEIGDARAVPALAAKLSDPAADIGDRAAEALGRIGDRAATPALMAAAEGPDAGVRVAALQALARIADPGGAPVILNALSPVQPSTCEAAASALVTIAPELSQTVADEALPRLIALLPPAIDRGMRLAAVRALRALAPRISQPRRAYAALATHVVMEEDCAVLAQAAGALIAAGEAAHENPADLVAATVPLLRHGAMRGLARAQLLEAIAQIGLGRDLFYPYLGLTDLARDEAAHRLLEEIRKRAPRNGERMETLLIEATEAYTEQAEYGRCLIRLRDAAAILSRGKNAPRAVLEGLAANAEAGSDLSAEEALLGILLLRRMLDA